MALLKADSFKGYATASDMLGVYASATIQGFNTPTNPTNSRSLELENPTQVVSFDVTPGREYVLQFWFGHFVYGLAYPNAALHFRDASSNVLASMWNDSNTGQIYFRPGASGTEYARTASFVYSRTDMVYLRIKINLQNDGTGSLTVFVNDSEEITYTGATADAAVNCTNIALVSTQDAIWRTFSNLVVMDTTGAAMNDIDGTITPKVIGLTADGVTTTMTPNAGAVNYDRVDEAVSDGDTTYVTGATVGEKDLYVGDNALAVADEVRFVTQRTIQRNAEAGTSHFAHIIQPDGAGAETQSPALSQTEEAYRSRASIWVQDPQTSATWTRQRIVDGIRVGQIVLAAP